MVLKFRNFKYGVDMLKTRGLGAYEKKKKKKSYIILYSIFFFFRTHLAPVARKCISIIKKVYQNTHEIKKHKL